MDMREAVPDDNHALQELQAKCPEGTDLITSTVNSPDFFAIAKAYEFYKVYVICEGKRFLGSTACGLRNAIVNGEVKRVGYGIQTFVAPEHRRKGIASKLHQHRENYSAQQGAVLIYAHVIENNIPSMRCLERRGYKLHRTVVMPGLSVYKEMNTNFNGKVRPAQPEDLTELAELLNETWQNYELYEPTSAEGLSQFISRTPGFSFDNLFILENRNKILAFLGYLDWSQIRRITIKAVNLKMRALGLAAKIAGVFRPMPKVVKPGDILEPIKISHLGFRDPTHFSLLLKHLNNHALQKGIEQIFFTCEKDHVMLKNLKGFLRIHTKINLYVKSLQHEKLNAGMPVFINGVD